MSFLDVLMECFELFFLFFEACIHHPEKSAIFIQPDTDLSCGGEPFSPDPAMLLMPRDTSRIPRHQGTPVYS